VNTASDPTLLRRTLDAARSFEAAPADDEMRALHVRMEVKPLFLPGYEGVR
jgi:hypothetical protein